MSRECRWTQTPAQFPHAADPAVIVLSFIEMILRNLFVGQDKKGFLFQALNDLLGDLRCAKYAIQPGSATVGAAQHGRIDGLRAQTAHFDPVIAMANGE